MTPKRPPFPFLIAVAGLLAIGALWLLTWLGVPPFDNIAVFLLSNVVALMAVVVLGVLGGAFVGLMLAQRIFATREFSPFERAVLESLHEIRERQEALAARVDALGRVDVSPREKK